MCIIEISRQCTKASNLYASLLLFVGRYLRPRIPLVKPLLDSLLESSKPQENLFPFGVIAPKTSS
ncbi:unnamed protein product, partial [Vitis vinifera]|uniref:Uncharacterized protein n=1 Tax=Vitis vinifera TaxID=29760 RepID=D7SJG0_VITVI